MTIKEAVKRTFEKIDEGREFTARQFKTIFDGIYGDNSFYIDTVMREARESCRFLYQYSHKTRLYTRVNFGR